MKFKFAASLLIVGSYMLSLAFFLPVEQMDTHVYGHSNPSNSIAYTIPGTAGVMARCTVPDESIQAMKPDTEIVVKTSILGTCIDVGEIRCQNLVCSSEAQGIIDADQFIRGAMQYAYGDKYQSVGILSHEYPGYLPQIAGGRTSGMS